MSDKAEADLAVACEALRHAQAREARLQEYLSHTPHCPIYHWQGATISTPPDCTCGLEAALAERGDNPVWEVVEALREIKANEGKVCQEFELCKHVACQSSYASWAIADEALTRLDGSAKEKG